jgi:S-methylmethionine-dependent homocysteine/selenocysteine methylase
MRAAALTNRAVDLCLEAAAAADHPVAVAGTLAPLEGLAHPEATPASRVLAAEHSEQAARLGASGCDVILVEPMPTLRETLAATAAAHHAHPAVWTTLALRGRALLDGTALELAAQSAVAVGAQALILTGAASSELSAAVGELAALGLQVPLGVRPTVERGVTPERFAADATAAMHHGAQIAGGGAGTTLEHVRALSASVRARAAA